ncbi:MAG: IgGFc-binding protein, partial [Myxococcales bacterium]|nr:IgGFc-binding protein [Myxococcales bacterium]
VDESTCEAAAQSLTSAGCLFAPIVTKPNNLPWAVIAANTGDVAATATLYDPGGAELESALIQPGELHIFEFANVGSWAIDASTTKGVLALRLESDRPVVAYQFLPYSSSQVATSDAALLLPEHAWGDNYLALVPSNDGSKWLTVVSLEDNNEVKVYIPGGASGSTMAGGGVPSLSAGQMHTETLGGQEVLRIAADASGDPISGAAVYSSAPVAVFVGSPGMSLPGPGFQGWQDSLEEQVQPRAAWGTEYAVVKFRPRGVEGDVYRIIADKDGTVVTLTGDYQDQFTLDEGEFVEFLTDQSFYASGNEAFLIGHYLVSASENSGMKDDGLYPGWFTASNNCGDGPTSPNSLGDLGDPAIGFIPPIDQFRSRYTFLTPYTYSWDMVTVVADAAGWASISLDGQPLPDPTPLGGGAMVYARFLVEDGAHYIESPSHKFGIEVYGYDCRISYVYPGGLSLGSINVPPPPPE